MAITEFATSGGLDFEAQMAGRQSEGLATAYFTRGCTDEKARQGGSLGGEGGSQLFCIQCVVSLGPAEETS